MSGFTTGSVASYTCNVNYQLDGSSTRVCTDGQWSGTAPVCVPVPSSSVPPPATTQQPPATTQQPTPSTPPPTGVESQSQ